MSTLQATRNLFTTCAVYEHHLYTESRIHAAACGVCQPEYSDAVYATVVDRGTHITHVQMAEVWNCVCNNMSGSRPDAFASWRSSHSAVVFFLVLLRTPPTAIDDPSAPRSSTPGPPQRPW